MKSYKQQVREHKHLHFNTDQTDKKGLAGQRISHILFQFSVFKVSGSWAKYQPSYTLHGPPHIGFGQPAHYSNWHFKPTLIRLKLQLQLIYFKLLNFPVFQRKLWSGSQNSAEMTFNACLGISIWLIEILLISF